MNWTPEQLAIFSEFRDGKGNVIAEALAGSGKTTTIIEAFSHAPEKGKILYAVFNKRNQIEAAAKIKDPRVEVKTLHSVGLYYVKKVWRGVKADFDNAVEFDRVKAALLGDPISTDKEAVGMAVKLVGFLKNITINPSRDEAAQIAEDRDCLLGSAMLDAKIIDAALKALELSKTQDAEGRISGNDMVWLPVALDVVSPMFSLVVIDEAQDMNLPQLTMARKASNGRVVVVGDRNQAIYGFRGAAANGMSSMKVLLRAKELGLTISQRCSKSVAREAAQIVPAFKPTETAVEGSVTHCKDAFGAVVGDAILSRLNAPMMPLALQFLRKDIPARIEGKDFGAQLLNMIRGFRADSIEELIGKIRVWEQKQCERAAINSKGNEEKISKKCEQFHDTADSLIALTEGLDTVQAVTQRIDNLFQDTNGQSRPAVTLSTVHKAKGLEWNRVFVLQDTFGKNKNADACEERNIRYVAITRARVDLVYVGGSAPLPEPTKAAAPTARTEAPKTSPAPTVPSRKIKAAQQDSGKSIAEICAAVESAAKKLDAQHNKMDNYSLPIGQVYYKRGDVQVIGGAEYVCEMVNKSRSRWLCLTRKVAVITDKLTDKVTTFSKARETIDISATRDESSKAVIRQLTEDQMKEFLAGGARAFQNNETQSERKKNVLMAKKTSSGEVSYAGRGDFIRSLRDSGCKRSELMEKVLKKYPGSSSGKCFAVFDSKSNGRKVRAVAKSKPAPAVPKRKGKDDKKKPTPPASKPKAAAAKPEAKAPATAPSAPPPPPVRKPSEAPAAEPQAKPAAAAEPTAQPATDQSQQS